MSGGPSFSPPSPRATALDAVAKWHDPAGFTILAVCFFVLCILARLVCGAPRGLIRSKGVSATPFPSGLARGLGAWLLLTLLGTEVWYRSHETHDAVPWSFEFPASKENFSDIAIPEPAVDLLKFDSGRLPPLDGCGRGVIGRHFSSNGPRVRAGPECWRDPIGPKYACPQLDTELHGLTGAWLLFRPTISQFPSTPSSWAAPSSGRTFSFAFGRMVQKNQNHKMTANDWSRWAGLQSVLLGERNLAQQTLEIIITGCATPEEAEDGIAARSGGSCQD